MNTTHITFKSIDIHSHIMMGVDHGSRSFEQTKEMLNNALDNSITDIVCTPHFNEFVSYQPNYIKTKNYAKKLGIKIYPGNELLLTEDLIEDIKLKKIKTLNKSKYLLVELNRNNKYSFDELCEYYQEILDLGYRVIIAHPELIENTFRKKKELEILRKKGLLFQIDAYSYYKKLSYKRYINKLIKLNMLDFVASDIHIFKKDCYESYNKLYQYLVKKYGKKYANKIYYYNPKKVIDNK